MLMRVHPGCCTGVRISFQYETLQQYHVNKELPLISEKNWPPSGLEWAAHP